MSAYFIALIIPFLHCSSNVSSLFFLLKISQKHPLLLLKGPVSVKSVRYPKTLWKVYDLSNYSIRPAFQSRYLESKFRVKYTLNEWPRDQNIPPHLT